MRSNKIVATSWLMETLWPHGDPPASAKKILQNAVSRLRSLLSSNFSNQSVSLTTQPPGYILRVQDDLLDLNLFNRLTENARASMAQQSHQEASLLFKEALSLWRGPALVDLVEAGVEWPELGAVQNSRIDVQEDLFEAELQCGRHQSILPELEQLSRSGGLRERSSGQLMLALYRSGRQADALNVYSDMRTNLVEELGLEPSKQLQELQKAILNQSSSLSPPREVLQLATPAKNYAQTQEFTPAQTLLDTRVPDYPFSDSAVLTGTDAPQATPVGASETATVALIRIHLEGNPDTGNFHSWRTRASMLLGQTTRLFSGTMVSFDGSVATLMWRGGTAPTKATRAVACIQDLVQKENEWETLVPTGCKLLFSAVMATDDVWFTDQPDPQGTLASILRGPALDISRSLLEMVLSGEIQVCDDTRRTTSGNIEHSRSGMVHGKPSWLVRGMRLRTPDDRHLPLLDRETELAVLQSLLDRARSRSKPHMVTLLGDSGSGKSHLLMELVRRVEGLSGTLKVLSGGVPDIGENYPLATESKILCDFCGISPRDSTRIAAGKLRTALIGIMDEKSADLLVDPLMPLIVCDADHPLNEPGEALTAWQAFLQRLTGQQPVMMVLDDLHLAPKDEMRFLESLTQRIGDVPLMMVCSARPELLHLRPYWGGGRENHTVLTLDPLSDHAIDKLTKYVFQDDELGLENSPAGSPAVDDRFLDSSLTTSGDLRLYTRTLLRLSGKGLF